MGFKKGNTIRAAASDRIYFGIVYVSLALILILTIYPLYFVIIASFSNPSMVALGQVFLYPRGIGLKAYEVVFRNASIWHSYLNTVIYTALGTLFSLSGTMIAAFVFSKKELKGSRACMLAILFTMYFSGGLIPSYLNIKRLGMINTIWALVVPGAISGYNMILARTYIRTNIHDALGESAMIDGASPIRIFLFIVLPLCAPIIGVLTLYNVVGQWNSYYSALIYIYDRDKYPLQLILREILTQTSITAKDLGIHDSKNAIESSRLAESMKYALIVVSSVPMLAIYPFLQKFFIKGIMIGSIKG